MELLLNRSVLSVCDCFFVKNNFCNHIVDFFCVGNRTMKSVIEQ